MPDSLRRRAYLDYAATAPFDVDLWPILQQTSWANANSLHSEGKQAAAQLREARARIAQALGAHAPSEIIFTSGGTESINMALKGLVHHDTAAPKTHVVVSALEHHAVRHAASSLKGNGYKIDVLGPDPCGLITPDALDALLSRISSAHDATCLVCVQAVNNETGIIQPVEELARVAHAYDALFFCDAVQALGKLEQDLDASGIDTCAYSGHKIGAPKGIGVLYLRRGLRLAPLMHGGGQEAGMRSGTSNVPAACALAHAIEHAVAARADEWEHALALKEHLLDGLECISCVHRARPTLSVDVPTVPHIVSLLVDGLEGETIVLRADAAGIALSSGSACSSASLDPSHVLLALGVPKDRAYGGVRISFGSMTATDDIDMLLSALPEVLK